MGSRYRGASNRDKMSKMALTGDHWAAKAAAKTPPRFGVGDRVRVKKTGVVTQVEREGHWGYVLKGYPGGHYFPPDTIEKV